MPLQISQLLAAATGSPNVSVMVSKDTARTDSFCKKDSALALPEGLKVTPWAHQLRAYSTLLPVLRKQGGCLLAAEMGVGKTLIATMLALGLGSRRTLIACPLRVISSWRSQLTDYLEGDYLITTLDDSMSVAKRVGKLRDDVALAEVKGIPHWVVINYDSYWREAMAEALLTIEFGTVIYDESHKLKSPGAKASNFAKRLLRNTKHRILATGTPLAHSPLDAFAQVRAAVPGLLGTSYVQFKNRYATWGGPNRRIRTGYQNIPELESRLAPVTWRATKEEVLPDLPEALPPVIYECELGSEGAKAYRDMERDMIVRVQSGELTAKNILDKLTKLCQITSGYLPETETTPGIRI
ncbi:MAG: SNF2-related protein, partial [Fluviibacter sp.]